MAARKSLIQACAYILLLAGPVVFGFLRGPAEMLLALTAGAIALVFSDLDRFKRVKGAGFEAELREQIEAVVEKQTEPFDAPDSEGTSPLAADIDFNTKAVMKALYHPQYTWRYLAGIVKDSGLARRDAELALSWLVENGFARRSYGRHGAIWSLTQAGRDRFVIDEFEALPTPTQ